MHDPSRAVAVQIYGDTCALIMRFSWPRDLSLSVGENGVWMDVVGRR
jgi:hypothetical protein